MGAEVANIALKSRAWAQGTCQPLASLLHVTVTVIKTEL